MTYIVHSDVCKSCKPQEPPSHTAAVIMVKSYIDAMQGLNPLFLVALNVVIEPKEGE